MRAALKKNDFNAYEVSEEFLARLPRINATVCFTYAVGQNV